MTVADRHHTPIIADTVFIRTPAGQAACKADPGTPAAHGLSERARYLLQRLDGTRSSVQLLRVFRERELAAYLAVLEVTGLIRPVNDQALRELRAMYSADQSPDESLAGLFAWADLDDDDDGTTGMPPDPVMPGPHPPGWSHQAQHLAALSASASSGEFGSLREQLLIRMLRLIGAAGEPFALRITRCDSAGELRNLVPAILSVIEVKKGPDRARQFARETLS